MIARTGTKIRWITLVLISGIALCIHSCISFRMSPKEVDAFFHEKKVSATQHSYRSGFRELHYVKAGDPKKPLILFLHGSPGSLSAFIGFLADSALLTRGLLITTDRPGFGYSNFGNGEPSLQKQGEILRPILEKYKTNRPIILVGHSLAGALIVRMAAEYPDLVDGLIIVAGSVDPELEPNEFWFRAPLATPFLSWMLPNSFRASNQEIYQLKPELEKMVPLWKNVSCPVIVIQGKKDELVPPANADFARKMLINAPVEFILEEDMNHFVPWSHPHLIHDAILKMIETTSVPTAGSAQAGKD
ncbi:MAG TPA: alpha/beta hydrolase [Chryseolinea sp.]